MLRSPAALRLNGLAPLKAAPPSIVSSVNIASPMAWNALAICGSVSAPSGRRMPFAL